MKKVGLLAIGIAASLSLSGCSFYDIADSFSGLGKGSSALYVNENQQMPGEKATILPGASWLDTNGNVIQDHGGQIQLMPVPDENGGKTEKYVWVGEDKSSGHLGNDVAVYISDDLYHWESQGNVFQAVESREQLNEDFYFQKLYADYTSENNKTLYSSKLNEDYTYLSTDPEKAVYKEDFIRIFPGAMREAPVLFKGDNGRYYLMSSSTTGWMSNQARVWSADEIFGDWQNDGNPCVGTDADITFDTQSTCVFQTKDGQWIYYGDRWDTTDLADSRYIWLPLTFEEDKVEIKWNPEFTLD